VKVAKTFPNKRRNCNYLSSSLNDTKLTADKYSFSFISDLNLSLNRKMKGDINLLLPGRVLKETLNALSKLGLSLQGQVCANLFDSPR
jgi:hypothetical protein